MIDVKKISFVASAALIALFSGCVSVSTTIPTTNAMQAPAKVECLQDGTIAPSWVCKPEVEDAYASLGMAENSEVDKAKTVKNAISNGRIKIAKQMQSLVREKLAQFVLTPEGANKEKVDDLVASIVNNINPEGIELPQTLQSSSTLSGKTNVHVIASKSSVEAELKRAVSLSYKNDRVVWLSFNSKQAISNLEKEFDVVMPMEKGIRLANSFSEEIVSNRVVGRNRK